MPSSSGLDGIINLHKPTGLTSAKTLYRVRSITKQRKSGHAGTLDPLASGVLVLCLGKATKLVEAIMDQPKVYRATARLDVTSESFDRERPLVDVAVDNVPDLDTVLTVCTELEGVISQVPPAVSAIKIGGRPAYKLAGRKERVVLAPRPVRIDWIHVHSYTWPVIDFEMCCGRGTYVRALIRDLGERLGTGGCLTSLVRKRVGPFMLEDAPTLETLRDATDPEEYVTALDHARDMLSAQRISIPSPPKASSGTNETTAD